MVRRLARRAVLTGLLFLAPLAHSDAPLEQGWQSAGYSAEYVGIQVLPAMHPLDPLGWVSYEATVVGVDDDAVTLRVVAWRPGASLDQTVVYERPARVSDADGGAFLWIGDAEIAQGHALLGEATAYLTLQTNDLIQFNAGSRNYYFSAQTGLLSKAEDVGNPSATIRTR